MISLIKNNETSSLTQEYQYALKRCLESPDAYRFLPKELQGSKEFFLDLVDGIFDRNDFDTLKTFFRTNVSPKIKDNKDYCIDTLNRLHANETKDLLFTPLSCFSSVLYLDFDVIKTAISYSSRAVLLTLGDLRGNIELGTKACIKEPQIYNQLTEDWTKGGKLLSNVYQNNIYRFFEIIALKPDDKELQDYAKTAMKQPQSQDFYLSQFSLAEDKQIEQENSLELNHEDLAIVRDLWHDFYKVPFQHICDHLTTQDLKTIAPKSPISEKVVKDEISKRDILAISVDTSTQSKKNKFRKVGL